MPGRTALSGRIAAVAALSVVSVSLAVARDMKPTIYDDGISCPGGCDAHVVLNPSDNGTRYAYASGSPRGAPQPCKAGEACTICFDDSDASCMSATYRGAGPPSGTFDFTPAFYAANCGRAEVPAALKAQCGALDRAAAKLGYTTRINCFLSPDHAKCRAVMDRAKADQSRDVPKREACLGLGEAAYNAAQSDPDERRTNACNYSLSLRGGRPGRQWHLLLPAACRPGTYVDRFGLDCCSGDVRFAASNHPECASFFPR